MIGPWTLCTPTSKYNLLCLSCIDPATGWFEIVEVPSKDSDVIMEAFNNTWLCCYPQPQMV